MPNSFGLINCHTCVTTVTLQDNEAQATPPEFDDCILDQKDTSELVEQCSECYELFYAYKREYAFIRVVIRVSRLARKGLVKITEPHF